MSHTLEIEQPRVAANSRIDWLDALRGWAILGVVLVHAGQSVHIESGLSSQLTDAGRYGVQLFFIVSAPTASVVTSQVCSVSPRPVRPGTSPALSGSKPGIAVGSLKSHWLSATPMKSRMAGSVTQARRSAAFVSSSGTFDPRNDRRSVPAAIE